MRTKAFVENLMRQEIAGEQNKDGRLTLNFLLVNS